MRTSFDRTNDPAPYQWSKKQIIAIGLVVSLIITYLAFRFAGVQPVVMADEQGFNTYSRILDPSRAAIPSYLFYFIYHLTNRCGSGFLQCGRFLNLLQLGLISITVYVLGKKYLPKRVSAFIAVVTLLAPWGSYVTYYMPEILYCLIFLVLAWIILSEQRFQNAILFDCACGITFGLLSLIKPHALFLIPAYVAYRVYAHTLDKGPRNWIKLGGSIILSVAILLFVRLAVGYLIAGHAALNVFGSQYSGVVDKKGSLFSLFTLNRFYHVAKGHAYGLLLLLGFPLMAAFVTLTDKTSDDNRERKKIIFLASAALISMLGVTVAYTVQVDGMSPYESLNRLHMRYYFFVFPIFTIVGAFFCNGPKIQLKTWQKVLTVIVVVATLYGGFRGLNPYTPSAVDSPDLWAIAYRSKVLHLFALLQALALLLFVATPKVASRFFVYLLLPLLALNAALTFPKFFSYYSSPDAADKAGIFYDLTIGKKDPVAVVSDNPSEETRVIFHLNAKNIKGVLVPATQTLDWRVIAPDVRWIIALNENPLAPSLHGDLAYDMPGYKIWHLGTDSYDVDFSLPTWQGTGVDSVTGVSGPEAFGRWSDGKSITILFKNDVPANMSLNIAAFAFGPNAGQPFSVQVGDQVKQFNPGSDMTSATLSYANVPPHTRNVIITVPHPVSPQEMGMNADPRKLGIALNHLSIDPDAP
jgi:phosphoglycerol transferase